MAESESLTRLRDVAAKQQQKRDAKLQKVAAKQRQKRDTKAQRRYRRKCRRIRRQVK